MSMTSGFTRSRRSNKDETLYNAQNKMPIPQRLPTVRKKKHDDEKNWRFSYASSADIGDLEVFMEISSQKEPKTCFAQASGAPAWRHLVAVWQVNGSSGMHHDGTHILRITVSTLEHWRRSRGLATTSEHSSILAFFLTIFYTK